MHYKTAHNILAVISLVTISACSSFSESPMYYKGEKQSYNIGDMTNSFSGTCQDKDGKYIDGCKVTSKIILTNPDSNVSYQVITGNALHPVITCSSPAEVAKALATTQSGALSIPIGKDSVTASGSDSSSQSITLVQSTDIPSHYVAAAAFYNCLAYANGEYETPSAAAKDLGQIFDNAVKLSTSSNASSTAPDAPTITSVGPDSTKTKGLLIVKIKPPTSTGGGAITGYKVSIATPTGVSAVDLNDGNPDTTHVVTGLTTGTSYSFQVTATNANGTGKPSAASDAQPAP